MNKYINESVENLTLDVSCRFQHDLLEDSHCKIVSNSLLARNENLNRLSFYRCPLLHIQGIRFILKRISQLNRKRELELEISSVELNDDGLHVLIDMLFLSEDDDDANRRPNHLAIKSLELEDIGYVHLRTWKTFLPIVLGDSSTLVTLDLTHNSLKLDTVETIARLLETNSSLKNLILSENPSIGDRGASALSLSLRKNSCLKVLSLAVCNVTIKGIDALARCVQYNVSLSRVYLFGNPYNDGSEHRRRLDYWLDLNAAGRDYMRSVDASPALIPHFLSQSSNQQRSDLVFELLRQLPNSWCPAGPSYKITTSHFQNHGGEEPRPPSRTSST